MRAKSGATENLQNRVGNIYSTLKHLTMKKLRIGLTVLAVIIAAGSVMASYAASGHSTDLTYDWITYDQNGNQTGTFSDKTQTQMEQLTGCVPTQTTICAEAFDSQGNRVPSEDLHYQ